MPETAPPVVLVVEDEPDVAETYERWLGEYEVRRVETGADALAEIDDTVDVVLLDRMLPGMSGAEVLSEIRSRGVDCRVAMVTAVDPGFDVIEMGFDEYVSKPPSREQLRETVERLLDRAGLDAELQEYYSLVARRAALQTEFSEQQLETREEYTELVAAIEARRAGADDRLGDMAADANFIGAVREIMGDPSERDDTEPGELSTDEE